MFLVAVPNESTTPCVEIVKILYAVNGYIFFIPLYIKDAGLLYPWEFVSFCTALSGCDPLELFFYYSLHKRRRPPIPIWEFVSFCTALSGCHPLALFFSSS